MPAAAPILLIGLDGACYDVLDPLVAAGELPTLAGLFERGARGVLRSVVPPITPAAWSSFMTGKEPARHGVYDFRVYDARAYTDSFVTSHALHARTVWELLVRSGRRVATVSLPMTYPPRAANGVVVSGFDAPSIAAQFTHPPELRGRILERIPDYFLVAVPDPEDPNLEGDHAFSRFASDVERSFEQRTEVALALLDDGPWDVFMVHYQDVDVLQHVAWRFIAESARYPERHARVRAVYRHLDALLGRLLAHFGPDALVVVLSDHGFGTHTGRVFPNVLLRRWGYLDWRGRRRERLGRSLRKRLAQLGLVHARRRASEAWGVRVRAHDFGRTLPLRWRRTRAYVALAEIYGLLYVNLRGREPEGVVDGGLERELLLSELRARFLAVRDPRDGNPAFAEVLDGAEVYGAAPSEHRPDLILVPRPGYSVYRDIRPRGWIDHYPVLAGTHRPEGVLVAAGPGIRAGRLTTEARLVDLAPTVLAAAGVPVPDDLDGRVLSELFTAPPAITYTTPLAPEEAAAGPLSPGEEAEIADRLRALGYLA